MDLDSLCALPAFDELDPDTIVGVLEENARFVAEVIAPLNRIGDIEGSQHDPATNTVRTPHVLHGVRGFLPNLDSANLNFATLSGANLAGAALKNASMHGVRSGGIIGTPAHLPTGYQIIGGYITGAGVNLTGAALTNAT